MEKIIWIMRGLPGSGKSTEARIICVRALANGVQEIVICSTDSFFINKADEYVFDASKLGAYHGANQYKVEQHMRMSTSVIVVDNTNTTSKEMKPYLDLAHRYGYKVWYHIMGAEELYDNDGVFSEEYIAMCVKRNTHGVPREAIERMARRFKV